MIQDAYITVKSNVKAKDSVQSPAIHPFTLEHPTSNEFHRPMLIHSLDEFIAKTSGRLFFHVHWVHFQFPEFQSLLFARLGCLLGWEGMVNEIDALLAYFLAERRNERILLDSSHSRVQ